MADWKQNLQQTRYVMDALFLLSFIVVSAPKATGVVLHEWLSVLFIVPFFIHILLHWNWIKSSLTRLIESRSFKERFSIVSCYLLYVWMLLVFVSGVLVSVSLLPALNIDLAIQDFWLKIHIQSGKLMMPMIGIHLALYWNWIKRFSKSMLMQGRGV